MFHSKTLDVTYCTRPLTGFFSPLSRRQDIGHACKRSPGLPHAIYCYTKRPYDGELFQPNFTLNSLKRLSLRNAIGYLKPILTTQLFGKFCSCVSSVILELPTTNFIHPGKDNCGRWQDVFLSKLFCYLFLACAQRPHTMSFLCIVSRAPYEEVSCCGDDVF